MSGEAALKVGGDLGAAYLGNKTAGDAASEMTSALNQGLQVSDEAIQQGRSDVLATAEPGLEDLLSGFQGAISTLEGVGPAETGALALSGAAGAEAEQGAIDDFMESPGQRFLREQGERTLTRNAAKLGGLGGGNVRRALVEHGIGTAATQQQQRLNNMMQMINPETARSTNIANMLATSGGQLAGFRGGIGSSLANISMGGLANQLPLIQNAGTARASGILGQGSAVQQGIGNVSKTLGQLYG